ncbi:hypothetical protein [Kangiella sp. HZ709]|uniref:hypothetical protein n=1 Tax=Kangiella sp. HZ709 TaxID=2666328 RepID=UPI0012AF41CA|nr:hypothetical protein [Kangiella sp. HZ709]MRX27107.1 hypothetical protein [Kangiella sp. HZ709]
MKKILLAVISVGLLAACETQMKSKKHNPKDLKTAREETRTKADTAMQDAYFQSLILQCGKTFVGKTVFPDDPNHDFAGKTLVAHLQSCTDKEIRIPFQVGEDKSRTWIVTKTEQGLLLKHDHRHKDGTPDEITMYGGYAGSYKGSKGAPFKQHFLADKYTAKLIPAASSNVWTISLDPEKMQLTYDLERHQKPRYKAILNVQTSND